MFLGIGILLIIFGGAALFAGFIDEGVLFRALKIVGAVVCIAGIISIIVHFNTAEGARMAKNLKSNTSGGLERTVEVYDQNGNKIKEYSGKIDVQDTEYGNKVLFDLDGKRTIIYNATVIVQEK